MNLEKLNARRAVLVTPSDVANLPNAAFFLYIGGAGNVRVTTIGGDDIVFTALPVGTILPVQVLKVWSTNTTATLIVGLF